MDRYNNYKKPEFSQQARRGSNYQLSVDNRLLQETWRVHEQLWGLHSGMLLRPLSTSSSWGENYYFWRPRRRYKRGGVYQSMWRGWLLARRTPVRPSGGIGFLCIAKSALDLVFRDRQFCHCGNVEPPTEFKRGDWNKCGTSCPPTPMSPPADLGIVDNCGTTLHTMASAQCR